MTKILLIRIMEETENQKKITRIIQTASSVNNENLMRLIFKKSLTSQYIKYSFFTLIIFPVTFLGHYLKRKGYVNISNFHGAVFLCSQKNQFTCGFQHGGVVLKGTFHYMSDLLKKKKKFKVQETHTIKQQAVWPF